MELFNLWFLEITSTVFFLIQSEIFYTEDNSPFNEKVGLARAVQKAFSLSVVLLEKSK